MNGKERGFLLLTSHLGDPERKPLTVAQFRQLAMDRIGGFRAAPSCRLQQAMEDVLISVQNDGLGAGRANIDANIVFHRETS